MTEHTPFYYPYASFTNAQLPLLKVAALYFDKLLILDPEKASSGTIGIGDVGDDVALLEREGILKRVAPEEVLHKHETAIAEAIRADLQDPEFRRLCEVSGRAQRWTLALAKVPEGIRNDPQFQPLDRSMQRLMGEVAHNLAPEVVKYNEVYAEVARSTSVYDELRSSGTREIEYRYADYPLPLGESLMVNHALFASILHIGATPLTDDPFHNAVLHCKIKRARQIPEIRDLLEDRARQRKTKADLLAATALTDTQLDLPSVSPQLPLEEILQYRQKHVAELKKTREELRWLAREIETMPWSQGFAGELEHKTIPKIRKMLMECQKARDSWLKSKRARLALKALGLAAGAASATISLVLAPTPLLPVAVATGALGLVSGSIIPGAEWVMDWYTGKKVARQNGLHYLLEL